MWKSLISRCFSVMAGLVDNVHRGTLDEVASSLNHEGRRAEGGSSGPCLALETRSTSTSKESPRKNRHPTRTVETLLISPWPGFWSWNRRTLCACVGNGTMQLAQGASALGER
ncbi:hypothetical protein BDV98DRAFT_111240 [Pterulicium gracile]|uniref:Uncharacterized protein n=1 Tax=Pterulicium gracile TaxID=1884261 RepID=A0A5C3QE04_9AGAR|nr:hypothetical protein BDV98DRAFT_111240 [Pterula gracilis]